jgi:hypothetical protein
MGSPRWSRSTPAKISRQLRRLGIQVGATTVARLLKRLMGYGLRVNHKKVESGVRNPPDPKQRDRQFHYIEDQFVAFTCQGHPILSIDTKKKELIGNFRNNGRAWKMAAIPVNDHDYPSDAEGHMVPFGIYDPQADDGLVCVGDSGDTPALAVDSIERWWRQVGCHRYPQATDLLLLADCGGANGPRSRVWLHQLQRQLCDPYGLTVSVSHYPPGASKWNLIEHRLFSQITKSWAGEPLVSFDKALSFIRSTKTESGLRVRACRMPRSYATGQKIPQADFEALALCRHETLPAWNYTLYPWPLSEV